MTKTNIKTIIIIFLIQLTHIPHPVQSTLLKKNIWYVGNKIGLPQYNKITSYINEFITCNNIHDTIHHSRLGFGSFIGYQNNKNFNFELAYNWLGKIIYSNNEIKSSFKVQNIDISAKINYPLFNKILNIYTRLGGAVWYANVKNTYCNNSDTYHLSINDTSISPIYSLGIEYKIKKHLTTRLEYQKINKIGNINTIGAQSNHILINLNLLYYFSNNIF